MFSCLSFMIYLDLEAHSSGIRPTKIDEVVTSRIIAATVCRERQIFYGELAGAETGFVGSAY